METSRHNVHWDNGQNFGSPSSDTGSSASQTTTSTLQYVNSQILAQGFAKAPGLSLEGLSREDGDLAEEGEVCCCTRGGCEGNEYEWVGVAGRTSEAHPAADAEEGRTEL